MDRLASAPVEGVKRGVHYVTKLFRCARGHTCFFVPLF